VTVSFPNNVLHHGVSTHSKLSVRIKTTVFTNLVSLL